MSILTEMFCMRVLSPPVKCFARGSYPLQSNVLGKGPIPSSLCAMPIGFGSLCSCHPFDPYLHSSVLSFYPWGRKCLLFAYCNSMEMGSFIPPVKLRAKPLNGLCTGTPHLSWHFGRGIATCGTTSALC